MRHRSQSWSSDRTLPQDTDESARDLTVEDKFMNSRVTTSSGKAFNNVKIKQTKFKGTVTVTKIEPKKDVKNLKNDR